MTIAGWLFGSTPPAAVLVVYVAPSTFGGSWSLGRCTEVASSGGRSKSGLEDGLLIRLGTRVLVLHPLVASMVGALLQGPAAELGTSALRAFADPVWDDRLVGQDEAGGGGLEDLREEQEATSAFRSARDGESGEAERLTAARQQLDRLQRVIEGRARLDMAIDAALASRARELGVDSILVVGPEVGGAELDLLRSPGGEAMGRFSQEMGAVIAEARALLDEEEVS
ncbi:hypothetical protein [Caulobacter sp. DWR1-3-2b1]|uniref:hypothetical protein n=1 Tax=Caulobacter sp. DWR1-3-2b1 TaxID=2804670 RepID=UPI003CF382AA